MKRKKNQGKTQYWGYFPETKVPKVIQVRFITFWSAKSSHLCGNTRNLGHFCDPHLYICTCAKKETYFTIFHWIYGTEQRQQKPTRSGKVGGVET